MYNKKVLIDSLKKLGSAKAPTQKKDVIVGSANAMSIPAMKKGGTATDKRLSVKKSNIQGKGLFINEPVKKGEVIGLAHVNNQATPMVGKYHNHSEDNPTAVNISQGNKRYLVAARDLPAGTEITTNYRLQPELEQPEDFMQKGGMTPQKDGYRTYSPFKHLPFIDVESDTIDTDNIVHDLQLVGNNGVIKNVEKNSGLHRIPGASVIREIPMGRKGGSAPKLPKKKNSKAYSRSLEATNRFFAEHAFFAKPKSRKNKIYDPNAKYYQEGGATSPEEWEQEIRTIESQIGNPADWTMDDYYLLQDKLNAYRNWRETTPEGQAVVDYHNEEGEYDIPLPEHLQDYTNGMMKARLAYADMHGNPAAKRMINIPDNPYDFGNGMTGTHYMSSMDNYAVPQIQNVNGQLTLGDFGPSSNEAIKFDNPNDARYFAEHYKEVSPGFIEAELTPEEIEEYAKGGYIIEDISVPSLTKAQGGGGAGALIKYGTEASKIISGAGKVTPLLQLTNRAITPVGYGMMQKITAAPLTFVAPYKPKTFALQNRYDAWDIYNQAAPRYGGLFANDDGSVGVKQFEISKDVLDKIRESKKTAFETIDFNDDLLGGDAVNFGGVHGNGHAIKGVDEEGRKYIDFTDVWDLHPMEGFKFLPKSIRSLEAGKLTGGKPFQLRNRIYYDKDGQYFDHDGNSLMEYEREVPDMSMGSGLKKMQQNASKGNIEMLPEYNVSKRKFLTTQNISQDQFNAVEDDWDAAINRNRFYQLGTLGTGLGLGAYGAFQYEQSTKPRFVLNTESGQYELVTPAQIKAFPGRYIVDPRTKQKYGGALPKKQGGGLVKYSELIPALRSLTPGNALRATLYRGINPASYNVMEKAKGFPSELYGSAFNNETRPFRVGMSLKYGADEYLDTFLKTKRLTRQEFDKMPDTEKMMLFNEDTRNILQDIGRRRLDAWAVGLKQPQEYGTLEQIGDNTFRMKDIDYTPDFFSERYTDLQAQGLKDKGYYFGDEDPLVTLSRKHYDITPHPFMQRGVAKNFLEQELLEKYGNAPRSFIDKALGYTEPDFAPWSPLRHVGKSTINPDPSFEHSVWDNDSYGVMGGFRWDIANTPEGMHWQANDLWDINPWERRGSALLNPNETILKYLHGNYFKPLQNFEALSAVGGRPFNIQNNFLIDPVTFKPLKKWQKGGFLKRKKKQPAVVPPLDIVQPGEEAFPLPETPQTQLWYDPITVDTTMTQEELDAYNKAYEEEQARLKFEADKAAQPGYFDEARTWLTDWHNSPMYNQMVLNSYRGNQGNADYLTKLRKKNIETMPPLNVLGEDDGSAAAHSLNSTGQVEVFPSGYKYGPSLFVHEGLHSSDRPRELYKFDHPAYNTHKHMDDITMDDYIKASGKNESYFTDNGIVYDYPDWMVYNDPRFPNDPEVWHDRVMPHSDQMYITTHRGSNWKDNEVYKEAKNSGLLNVKTDEELKKEMIENGFDPNDPEFNQIFESVKKGSKISVQDNAAALKRSWKNYGHDYVSSPTEVRARLGEIRYGAQKNGIYDPFTEEITPEIFQNIINNGSSWQMQDAIDELRTDFTDEEILYMLQHISKNDSKEENPFDEQMAKFGGAKRKLKRRQNGGPSATVEEPLEETPTDPPASPVLTEAQQWITDWYKNRKLPTIQEDPRYNKDMMKILPAYNPESPILTNTTTFPQYIMDPSLGNLNPEGLNIGAAGTYEETKEGPVIRLNPALTPAQKTDTEIHELTNYMMAPVRDKLYNMQDRIVEQNIIPFNEDWTDEQKDFYDYVINHDEQNIQSYLNVARKNFGLKADEVITPEKIQEMKQQAEEKGMLDHSNSNFNPDIYLLFKMGKDEQGLSNLFNHIAKVDNESEDNSFMNYGKYGGAYELGDEVDEATMKKLKKLGYTFEKI
jgi:hypothetical protein